MRCGKNSPGMIRPSGWTACPFKQSAVGVDRLDDGLVGARVAALMIDLTHLAAHAVGRHFQTAPHTATECLDIQTGAHRNGGGYPVEVVGSRESGVGSRATVPSTAAGVCQNTVVNSSQPCCSLMPLRLFWVSVRVGANEFLAAAVGWITGRATRAPSRSWASCHRPGHSDRRHADRVSLRCPLSKSELSRSCRRRA